MIRWGIIRFFDHNNNLIWERQYDNWGTMHYIISKAIYEKDVSYYQVSQGEKYRGKRVPTIMKKEIVRPPAIYDNQKSLYAK